MILYLMPGACPLASHIALAWADADYTVHRLSREIVRGKAYRQINPKAVVPALFLDDGNVLTESLAILEYLAEKYPKARMGVQPDDVEGRVDLNEALAELVSDVHLAWSPIMVPERHVTLEANQADAIEAAYGQFHVHYSRLDALMRDKTWRLFDRRTVADAYLYVIDLDPSIQRVIREERLGERLDQLALPVGVIAAALR